MNKVKFGYVRVSSKDQKADRQIKQMIDNGINERNIFLDKETGATFNRRKYLAMLEILKPGDILFVARIDRLGRSYHEILEQWRYIVEELLVDIVVLDMPILDTKSDYDLTGRLISDIVLQLLSYVAQKETENIKQRQREGIQVAKERGVVFGRPKISIDLDTFIKWQNRISRGESIHSEAQDSMNIKHSTYYNLLKEYRAVTGRFKNKSLGDSK